MSSTRRWSTRPPPRNRPDQYGQPVRNSRANRLRQAHRVRQGAVLGTAVLLAYAFVVATGGLDRDRLAEPEPSGPLDEAAGRIAAVANHPVDRDQLHRVAVRSMLESVGDRWGEFYPAAGQPTDQARPGRYAGAGLWLRCTGRRLPGTDCGTGHLEIAWVQPASPAARGGIARGDRLLAVAGHPTERVEQAVALIGQAGPGPVQLRLVRGAGPHTTTVTRSLQLADGPTVTQVGARVVRIRLASFSRGAGDRLRRLLAQQPDSVGGVILDLRDNPGGLLEEAVRVAAVFLDGGPVATVEGRDGSRTLRAPAGGDTATRIVVLVNGGTASAAEIVAAALQDRHRAVVVGARSFGKGSVQEPARLSDGSAIKLTVGRYRTPAGRYLDGVGVDPDVRVDAVQPAVAEARASAVLDGLLASLRGGPGGEVDTAGTAAGTGSGAREGGR